MQPTVIEGTWEEIERRKAELIGRQLRVFVLPRTPAPDTNATTEPAKTRRGRVSAMGKYAGVFDSEAFMREKQDEIAREDRSRK